MKINLIMFILKILTIFNTHNQSVDKDKRLCPVRCKKINFKEYSNHLSNCYKFAKNSTLIKLPEEDKANMEDEPMDLPPPAPPPPPPQEVVVSVKKEEYSERVIDDTDQKELAKSMTRFFETLTEETKSERGEK